jgi:protein-disulfide isomerase
MPIEPNQSGVRWYATWWGKSSIVLGLLIIILAVPFVVVTMRYWWQIKNGQTVILQGPWNNNFTLRGSNKDSQVVDRTQLEVTNAPYLGQVSAPLVIVEFVDFKCPNCLAAAPIMQQLVAKYDKKIKIIMRNFPIESIHPGADELAVVAVCAARQGRYLPMSDLLFRRFSSLSVPLSSTDIHLLSMDAVVGETELRDCMADPKVLDEVLGDFTAGVGFGVAGTPTFFVNGQKVEGVVPLTAWQNYLTSLGY